MVIPGTRPAFWPIALAAGRVPRRCDGRGGSGQAGSGSTRQGEPRLPEPRSPRHATSAPPQVMSKAAALARRPRSPFLAPPGSTSRAEDRYNLEETDWSEIPPWRQTSFFGIRARGQFFIYVVDQSGSMIDDDRLTRAKIELRRSVFALQPPQRFEVIFYNDEATPMPGGPAAPPGRSADQEPARRLAPPDRPRRWDATADRQWPWPSLSDPTPSSSSPTASTPRGPSRRLPGPTLRKIPIHCVDFSGGQAGDHLKRIARDSGGQYASRPGSLQAAP